MSVLLTLLIALGFAAALWCGERTGYAAGYMQGYFDGISARRSGP